MTLSKTFRCSALCLAALIVLIPLGAAAQPEAQEETQSQETPSAEEPAPSAAEAVQKLATDFFEWRRAQQPVSGDDIPRVERPDGWTPDWSPKAVESYRNHYRDFLAAVDAIDVSKADVAVRVDRRLLRSAIQRVHWELDVLKAPRRDPLFYVQQSLGSVFELLIIASPMTDQRMENILLRLESIPATLEYAREDLDRPVRPFAESAITTLDGIEDRLKAMQAGLQEVTPERFNERLARAVPAAAKALTDYAEWLQAGLPKMQTAFAIGPPAYQWFLANVALIPYTPDELLAQGRQAWSRAVAWDTLERNRDRELPDLPLFENSKQQIEASFLKENEVRAFLEAHGLMTVPSELKHYRNAPLPAWLEPLSFLGVTDDLTSATRLDEDAYSYIPEPSPDLPYFHLSAARDPRPLLIHEGIPGHYFQLAMSWANPDWIRRHYFDSGANEGIGFYVEELLLQSGLFEFSPKSREIIYSFMRLRALRVEVDIRLAIGDFTVEQAAAYLERAVPMDRETARNEAVFFASTPGQAITYQIGKLQILSFLADARLDRGDDFSLRDFHDYLMQNGNVPIALQRWEYLGRDEQILRLDSLAGEPVTVPR